ncbi:MAG TPA: inositol monophosphatase family protein [Myxococcota bacterium]|nr:inositol monophosphatase family protein [Myxococcota bacterium]HOA13800.1 inositol monophosphatase family protein [Myxococcota bacterium]HOH76903.1 inositol monophosphatase family protein [Myxococcota bacterium]HPV03110.1 inositol monophosphatase family protein [Myxococcota bacterium]
MTGIEIIGKDRCKRLEAAVARAGCALKARAASIATVAGTSPHDENPHTNLDREIDDLLLQVLPEAWGQDPAPAWLSEEKEPPPDRQDSEFVFIIDPIDGTRNVLKGRTDACVSAAMWMRGQGVIWGSVFNPFTNEMFSACRGGGARLNGNLLQVSDVHDVRHAMFLVSVHESVRGMLDRVKQDFKVRPVGSIAYKMCLVACGRGDATFTVNPRNDWDVAAASLIVTEAGGRVTDSRGRSIDINGDSLSIDGLAVTNSTIHDGVLAICDMARRALGLH